LILSTLLLFTIEQPSFILAIASQPLKEQGISYGTVKGGLLSGIKIEDINYQNSIKVKELKLKVYWERLLERILHIDTLTLDGIKIEKKFLASLIDSNSSSDENTTLPFDKIVVDRANISLKDTVYDKYRVNSAKLKIKNLTSDMREKYKGDIKLLLDSNVTQLNLNGSIENGSVKLFADIEPNREFIAPFIADNNITLANDPLFSLKADGNMTKINYHLTTHRLGLKQNEYQVDSEKLILYGNYAIPKKDIDVTIKTKLNGSMAYLILDGDVKVNLDDINSTLLFDIDANIAPKKEFVKTQIADSNISIKRITDIDIDAKGDLKETKFRVSFKNLEAQREDINLEVQSMLLTGKTNPLQGDTSIEIVTNFNSTVGEGHIENSTTLNFNQLQSTLKYNAKIDIDANGNYINSFLKEQNITIANLPKLNLQLNGNIDKLQIDADIEAEHIIADRVSKVILESNSILIDIKEHTVNGSLKLFNSSKNMDFSLESSFSGDYTKPKNMQSSSEIVINKFNDFGINLETLLPIDIRAKTSDGGALFRVDSDKIKVYSKTDDYDQFSFDIDTHKLYLSKIIKLPKELKSKFVKVDIKGSARVSKEYFNLKGTIQSNKKFRVNIDAINSESGMDAELKSQHLLATVKGDLKNRDLIAEVSTKSLSKLQQELNALYKFKKLKVDGSLKVTAKLKGEEVWAKIEAPKLKFDGFNAQEVNIDADYNKELITLKKLNFKIRGFEDKTLNQDFYLNKKGKIHLGKKRDILIDMYPNILIKIEGSQESLDGEIKIKKLPLGHPNYGNVILNCDINYTQNEEIKMILGDINLEKMNVFYELKFLDADYDSDVVIITKNGKKALSENSFLKNAFAHLKINASQAKYKTPDIDLLFDVNLGATWYKGLFIDGKIEEINGRVDQVPKRFKVFDSTIIFRGDKNINPILDINVEYKLPQVDININIGGDKNRPKIKFSSIPSMPKKDILSYLLLGVSTANIGKGEGSMSKTAELFLMNQAARDISSELELNKLFIKDNGNGEGFALEVGKKISKKNMFIIETSKEGNSFILERDVSKNIKLRVGQHQKDSPSQSIDIYFRKRFK
jgi:autotransporter translocation and assembly factor TamB